METRQLKYKINPPVFEEGLTPFEQFLRLNADNMENPAIRYFSADMQQMTEFTFGEISERVWKLIDALKKAGIKKGDRVAVSLKNTPEATLIDFALGYVGAINFSIDGMMKDRAIINYVNEHDIKMLIGNIDDTDCDRFSRLMDEMPNLERTLVVGDDDAFHYRENDLRKKEFSHPKVQSFLSFEKSGDENTKYEACRLDDDEVCNVYQSSGTESGQSKSIGITNRTLLASFNAWNGLDWPYNRGEVIFNAIPQQLAFGKFNSTIFPLLCGMTVAMTPRMDERMVYDFLISSNAKICAAAPLHLRFMNSAAANITPELRKRIQENGTIILSGGSKTESVLKCTIYENYGSIVRSGFGMNEIVGGSNIESLDNPNESDDVGEALPGVINVILDDDGNPVQPGQRGNLYIGFKNADTGKYIDNPEATAKARIRYIVVGQPVILQKTGDECYLTSDGKLHVIARKIELITTFAMTTPPGDIVRCVMKNYSEYISDCAVVGANTDIKMIGQLPIVYIKLKETLGKEERKKLEHDIYDTIYATLHFYEVPWQIIVSGFDGIIPYRNNKPDRVALEKRSNLLWSVSSPDKIVGEIFREHKSIVACATTMMPDDLKNPKAFKPVSFVVLQDGADAGRVLDELDELLRENEVDYYAKPLAIIPVADIPINDMGEIDHARLWELAGEYFATMQMRGETQKHAKQLVLNPCKE